MGWHELQHPGPFLSLVYVYIRYRAIVLVLVSERINDFDWLADLTLFYSQKPNLSLQIIEA